MNDSAKRSATYDDVLKAPDHAVAELIGGELITSPRPALEHARAASVLGMDLGSPFERGRGGPGGWWILLEPELHLGRAVLVPDLAGWRRERMPEPPAGRYCEVAPDWVCEVVSPSTAQLDRVRKLPVYAEAGVSYVWLVDPHARSLEVFRRHEAKWLLLSQHAGADRVRAEPFDAVELDLGALWVPAEGEPPR